MGVLIFFCCYYFSVDIIFSFLLSYVLFLFTFRSPPFSTLLRVFFMISSLIVSISFFFLLFLSLISFSYFFLLFFYFFLNFFIFPPLFLYSFLVFFIYCSQYRCVSLVVVYQAVNVDVE